MASGFGFNGGPSRCFSFWQDFRKCYVTAESAGECMPQKDDYLECLHHTKEHAIKRQAEESRKAREAAKKGGLAGPRLGLIDTEAEASDAQAGAKGDA
ncbi:hypothetical protein CBS9595_002897 [Malassezia furfur]|nr:hypothetical protein CBS9595_002897 [Malassezia furfur]